MRKYIAQQDDEHVAVRIRQGVVAGSEEAQDRVQETERHRREQDADDDVERQHIGEHLLCSAVVLLAQQHGDERHGAHADQRAHGRGQVHQGEGDGQAADGGRADARDMADVDAVDHVVQRSRRLGDDARDGVLAQEGTDLLGPEFNGSRSRRCHLRQGSATISRSKRSGEKAGMVELDPW